MGNSKSQHHSKYSETPSKRQKRDLSGLYPHDNNRLSFSSLRYLNPPVQTTPLGFHATHGANISITHGGKVASRTNSFCYAVAFTSRSINVEERVNIKLKTVETGWSGVMRFGFTIKDPSDMDMDDLPRYVCPDLTNRGGYWAKAMPEQFAQQNNIVSFYVNTSGTVFYSINDELQGAILEGVDVTCPLWALFDVYGNTTSLELVNLMENQIYNTDEDGEIGNSVTEQRPVNFPPNMQHEARTKLGIDESITPMTFSLTMGKQLKCRNRTQLRRREGIVESALAFSSTALKPGQTAYFYCAQTKENEIALVERMGFAVGITTCDPASIPIAELPFDSTMIMDRSEYWILFREFEPPQEREYFAFTVERGGCLSYSRERGVKTILFHMDVSQPLYIVLDMCSKVSCLAIVGMSTQSEIENNFPDFGDLLEGYTSIMDTLPNLNTLGESSVMSRTRSLLEERERSRSRQLRGISESSPALLLPRNNSAGPSGLSTARGSSSPTLQENRITEEQSELQIPSGIYPHASGQYPHENVSNQDGSSGAMAAAAMAAAPVVVSALSWLGSTMTNRWHQNNVSEIPSSPVEEESSSSSSSSADSERDAGSGLETFYNAHDENESSNDSDDNSISNTIDSNERLLEMLNADLTDLLRPLELTDNSRTMNVDMPGPSRLPQSLPNPSLTTRPKELASIPSAVVGNSSKKEDKQKRISDVSDRECVVCCDATVNSVMYSCGHACLCYECGQVILRQRCPSCPICRAEVKDVIRIYSS